MMNNSFDQFAFEVWKNGHRFMATNDEKSMPSQIEQRELTKAGYRIVFRKEMLKNGNS